MANFLENEKSISLKAGEVLFSKGSETKGIYLISKGYIYLYSGNPKDKLNADLFIVEIPSGELLGELSVMNNKPHSVTAIAGSDVEIVFIPKDTFLKTIKNENPVVKYTIDCLIKRFRKTSAQVNYFQKLLKNTRPKDLNVIVTPASDLTKSLMPDFIEVSSNSFKFSNSSSISDASSVTHQGLFIKRPMDKNLSTNHCEIKIKEDHVLISDEESYFGIIVNGERIGKSYEKQSAQLKVGDNYLVLGNNNSEIRFLVKAV